MGMNGRVRKCEGGKARIRRKEGLGRIGLEDSYLRTFSPSHLRTSSVRELLARQRRRGLRGFAAFAGLLVAVGDLEQFQIFERFSDKLDAHGQVVLGISAWNDDRRQTGRRGEISSPTGRD